MSLSKNKGCCGCKTDFNFSICVECYEKLDLVNIVNIICTQGGESIIASICAHRFKSLFMQNAYSYIDIAAEILDSEPKTLANGTPMDLAIHFNTRLNYHSRMFFMVKPIPSDFCDKLQQAIDELSGGKASKVARVDE